jgi:hypothetical protein
MTPEILTAVGYTGGGALAIKALDLLIKWRTGQHTSTLEEFDAARKLGVELRDELRKQLEELRSENVILDTKLEASEKERLELKALLEKCDNARKDAEAELRLMRKAQEATDVRGDAEEKRHSDFQKDEKRRRR